MSEKLQLLSVVGFGGLVQDGLVHHTDGDRIIYALGSTIVVRSKKSVGNQEFLQGHSDKVSCLALSPSGKYLATGQVTYMGFKADVIIWDLDKMQLLHRMMLHKVLWDVASGTSICGSPTHSETTTCVKFLNHSSEHLVTAGNYNVNVWEYDQVNNKLRPTDIQMGQIRRIFNCLMIDMDDQYAYCGTTSGDVLQIDIDKKMLKNTGPSKNLVPLGITSGCMSLSGALFVGGGDGSIRLLKVPPKAPNPKVVKKIFQVACAQVEGAITSMICESEDLDVVSLLIGTRKCEIHRVQCNLQEPKISRDLLQTAHSDRINSLAFPYQCSELFVTAGIGDVRVWHSSTCRELLRIQVANLECLCVTFSRQGNSIISGWTDGKIRAFGPQSGRELYTINNAHLKAVTAIASCGEREHIISGGEEGMVRIWKIINNQHVMIASMKEHKGPVNCIKVKESSEDECISCSSDGSCIIWDLTYFRRQNSLFANTFFKAIIYHPDESQVVSAGTDRKITYWDPYDGQAIRILDGSPNEPVNALAIDPDGEVLVSGGCDKTVRLWGYDEGHCYYQGVAHSGSITDVQITPDKSKIVSVGSEGGLFIWKYCKPDTDCCLE